MEIVADMTIPVKYSRKGEKATRRCQKNIQQEDEGVNLRKK